MDANHFTHNSPNLNIKARVIQSMTAQLDEEIDLFEGDIVTITNIIDETWYRGRSGERIGMFPSSHVELLHPYSDPPQIVSGTSLSTLPYEASSVSSRQLFKQCVESMASDVDSSVSSRQIYEDCDDSSTSKLGALDKVFDDLGSENLKSYPQVTSNIVPHGITLYPFCAQFDNELSFQEGKIVNLIRYIDKYWMEGEIDGKKGIFPATYVNIIVDCQQKIENEALAEENELGATQNISVNCHATVMFNFHAQMSGDLSVKEGEKVLVVGLINNDWCQVQNNAGQVGSVPCVYLSQVCNDTYQMYSDSEGGNAVDEYQQNSVSTILEFDKETSNMCASGRDFKNFRHSSEAMDLDKALLRNLAELSLSVVLRDSDNTVEGIDVTASKGTKCTDMLGISSHERKPYTGAPTEETQLKSTVLPSTKYDEVDLRRGSIEGSAKLTDFHHKRESIDRVPHRPAPPAPVQHLKGGHELVDSAVDSNKPVGADIAQYEACRDVEIIDVLEAEDQRKKSVEQRQNVIAELVITEKEFSRDMKITYETFNLHNPSFLESYGVDVKQLFGNILEVIHVSEDFVDQLQLALKGKSEENQCVGQCFLNMAGRMKSVYSEYTVNHDNVLTLLEKYDSDPAIKRVLDKGVETLRYQISCFDMGSILIKPVQRVLKYPLIVNELIKFTEDDHEDKPDLEKAVLAMMDVATDINENKRRKDIVVKYLEDNPSTISSRISRITLHSVAKKSNRIGALLSSSLGIKTGARDELYDEQENLFYTLDKMVRSFLKNAETFVSYLQETFYIKCLIAENLVNLYDEDTTLEVDKYSKIVKNISSQFLNEFKRTVNNRVSVPLTLLLECFEGPWKLVQKRYDKLLDYEAYCSRMDKSKDNRQGTMNIMKNTFTALNNQLLEELPVLISLSTEVFAECVKAFVLARKLFVGKITKQYLALFSEISEGNPNYDEPQEQFVTKHSLMWNQLINSPCFVRQPKSDAAFVGMPKSFPSSGRGSISASNAVTSTQSSSQEAYLQSYYHISRLYKVIENYNAKEYLELTVSEGQLLGVIKKQNPMGDPKIWFVDNGASQGFVPSSCLCPVNNATIVQSVAEHQLDQAQQPPTISHGSLLKKKVGDAPTKADSPPSYDSVMYSNIDEATGHVYEEINDEMFYVLHDLTSSTENTLSVQRGQVVKVLHKEDYDGNTEWWFVEDKFKNTGYVPANYLSKYD